MAFASRHLMWIYRHNIINIYKILSGFSSLEFFMCDVLVISDIFIIYFYMLLKSFINKNFGCDVSFCNELDFMHFLSTAFIVFNRMI